MAHAGRREIRGELAIDALAQPDQDPGREPRFGLGQDARERRRRVPADGFQRCGRFDGSRFELEVLGADRAGHAGPLEVRAVWRVGAWLGPPVDGDPLAGRDDRVAGERRGKPDGSCAASASSIVAIWRPSRGAPVATTTAFHGPSPSGNATASVAGGGRTARRTAMAAAAHRMAAVARHMTTAEPAGHRAHEHQQHRRGHRETAREDPEPEHLAAQRRADGPDRQPAASRHVSARRRGRGPSRTSSRRARRASAVRRPW